MTTGDVKKQIELFNKLNENNRTFKTSTTVNILNDSKFTNIHEQHEWQRYELFRKYEQLLPNKAISPIKTQSMPSSASSFEQTNTPFNNNEKQKFQLTPIEDNVLSDMSEDLRTLTEQHIPELSNLDGEPLDFTSGCPDRTKFYCTINDILTSSGEFWVEREYSPENEQKFRQFMHILSLYATSYESLKEVYIGQLVALHYESSWHRALVVSKSNETSITKPASARVRLVDYGSSLYVNVCQLKWLPEQFYLFPFKAVECVFSEAIKPTFSDTVRLTFKQLVLRKRLRATVYDKDGTRLCVLLKCKTEEGTVNVYRYLRAHEHKTKDGRMLDDGDIVQCLHNTIFNHSNSHEQSSILTNNSINLTLPLLSPPSPIKLTREQIETKRQEIKKILQQTPEDKHILHDNLSTPFSSDTIITPMSRLSFTQQ